MNKIRKTIALIAIFSMLAVTPCQTWAMGNRTANNAVDTANSVGNNDAAQQAAGDIGAKVAEVGSKFIDRSYELGRNSPNISNAQVNQMAGTGTSVWVGGKAVELGGKAAPHVGWMASAGGRAYEGDYSGAALEATNGAARTTVVGYVGTGVGIWAGGKIGAMAGSWGGPVGAFCGFVIGVGSAYTMGLIWDNGIGKGKDKFDQWDKDMDAQNQYGGQRRNQRQNVKQIRRNVPPPSRGPSKRCDGRGSCGR